MVLVVEMKQEKICLLYTSCRYLELPFHSIAYLPAGDISKTIRTESVSYTHLDVYKRQATADFLLYLDFPNAPLTGIVLVRHTWIGEKGK